MNTNVVLIHGYSSEGKTDDTTAFSFEEVSKLYGTLAADLKASGMNVQTVDVGRYISLEDGISIDDISLAFDRAIKTDHSQLLEEGFSAIVHSTGALVIRNWVRRFTTPGECPIRHIIYLAGANFGSGLAHIGRSQSARFLRGLMGVQPGTEVLEALELGSNWTINLQKHFTLPGLDMQKDYKVVEACLIGSQTPPEYWPVPIRYVKEDGSDGVVRVSSCNLNWNYIEFEPSRHADDVSWDRAKSRTNEIASTPVTEEGFTQGRYYRIKSRSQPGFHRVPIPFAIPFATNHSDSAMVGGIVSGSGNRETVLDLIKRTLAATPETIGALVAVFDEVTAQTMSLVRDQSNPGIFGKLLKSVRSLFDNPKGQYDPHCQFVVRVRDQFGKPINDFSVFFNSYGGDKTPDALINRSFEDSHKNDITPNCICFYLRLGRHDKDTATLSDQLAAVKGATIEVDATEPKTDRALFLPFRLDLDAEELKMWLQPHRTTVLDVTLYRLPAEPVFRLVQEDGAER